MMKVTQCQNTKNIYLIRQNNRYLPSFTSAIEEFEGSPEYIRYKDACNFANRQLRKHSFVDLNTVKLNRLEGIQYGIDVFNSFDAVFEC